MNLTSGAHTGKIIPALLASLLGAVGVSRAVAQERVDYHSQIQPIFDANCGGGFCHLGEATNGVELTSHDAVLGSVGLQYELAIVVPFDAPKSPLWLKISEATPKFGERMPYDLPPLDEASRELIARWIDEGAGEFAIHNRRGDLDASGTITITDAIRVLEFLFLGGQTPRCDPVADANADGLVNLSDAVAILEYLFMAGPELSELSVEEQQRCNGVNQAPAVEPIGTVTGHEGLVLQFQVFAIDPDGDPIEFTLDVGPEGLSIDSHTGLGTWSPAFGQTGDHRIVVRVSDDGGLAVTATGLIRIEEGNHAPVVDVADIVYGRETSLLAFTIEATDADDDQLSFEALEAPAGSTLDPVAGEFRWVPTVGMAGEHALRFRVSDGGSPPQSTEGNFTLVIVERDSPVNQPPTIPSRAVYRSYPGMEIRLPVDARDPDGHDITYTSVDLPDGAQLDTTTGILSWTPEPNQIGPYHIPVTVTDSGIPPGSAETILAVKILPPDACVNTNCDPATGCAPTPIDSEQPCCNGEPGDHVAEPVADCPGGRVLFAGRNKLGFGRLQNCDRLQLRFFAQGGVNITIHVETRCLATDRPVLVSVSLTTGTTVLVDRRVAVNLQERNDGYAQAYGLVFGVDRFELPAQTEGLEALLTIEAVDGDGNSASRELRLVLTRLLPDDLPDPDIEDVPAGEVGCIGCHRPLTPTGEREGIEDAHPWYPLVCTDCHGGDAEVFTKSEAHVEPQGGDPAFLRNLSSDELDGVSYSRLLFVNPGDLRVADRGCGRLNPASGATGCHQSTVESTRLSVMSTYAGHYTLPRFLAGTQDLLPIFAAIDVENPDFDAATAPEGAIGSLAALREVPPEAVRNTIGTCMDIYIPKSCPTCHLSDFGPNDAAGNFRSSGCTGCHMVYDDDGLSQSADPVIDRDFPPHPIRHQLTTAIPTEQCTHCHFQGGRIGLSYRGIREGGFDPEKTPANGETLGVPLHAHDRDYYFTDEDTTNNHDETPPDAHFAAGMDCADCHIGGDVHGDGNLYMSERYQVGIRCEDCHGTVRAEIVEDPADGHFRNSKGDPLRHLRRAHDDRILLKLHREDRELEIPQIHRIIDAGINSAMIEAMGVNESGFSHTDSVECYACHTSWRQTCFGCHITIDDAGTQTNTTTGEVSRGAISVSRDDYSIDFFTLGVNQRGKITPLCSSMSVFMSYRDESGVEQFRDQVRTSSNGRRGFGWNPFYHHTVSRVPQNCDRCHPVEEGAEAQNTAILQETYGFGNGKFTAVDGDGVVHDLSAFLDPDGNLISEFPHPNTGPVPAATRQRALSIRVMPHPRN